MADRRMTRGVIVLTPGHYLALISAAFAAGFLLALLIWQPWL